MFGDRYIIEIGSATENEAKVGLYHHLHSRFLTELSVHRNDTQEYAAALAAAITNRVFGEATTGAENSAFANANAAAIDERAHSLSSDEALCALLSGAAYNTCYARYVKAGGSRGPFSNAFLTYIRTLRFDSIQEARQFVEPQRKALDRITPLGKEILKPIDSMILLGIFRSLPYSPNERAFYDAVHQFALSAKSASDTQPFGASRPSPKSGGRNLFAPEPPNRESKLSYEVNLPDYPCPSCGARLVGLSLGIARQCSANCGYVEKTVVMGVGLHQICKCPRCPAWAEPKDSSKKEWRCPHCGFVWENTVRLGYAEAHPEIFGAACMQCGKKQRTLSPMRLCDACQSIDDEDNQAHFARKWQVARAAAPSPSSAQDAESREVRSSARANSPESPAIKVQNVSEEYAHVRSAVCACGGSFDVHTQYVGPKPDSKDEEIDTIETTCRKCGAFRQFVFDISSFFSRRTYTKQNSNDAQEPAPSPTPVNDAADRPEEMFDPKKMEAIVARLQAEGRMPQMDEFLRGVGEVRAKYRDDLSKTRGAGPDSALPNQANDAPEGENE